MPYRCKRLQVDYPDPPDWTRSDPRIVVQRTEDYGPMTKFAPLLDGVIGAEAAIILFDDDTIYPDGWWSMLLSHYDGSAAVGCHGSLHKQKPFVYSQWNTSTHPCLMGNLSTAWGVVYPRSALPQSTSEAVEFVGKYDGLINNDDMALASWCYQRNIPLKMIPVPHMMIDQWQTTNPHIDDPNSVSITLDMTKRNQIELAKKMIVDGVYPPPWPEITVAVILVVVLILFLFFAVLLLLLALQ